MKETKYIEKNGVPYFKVGEEEIPAVAYITYFEERNEYKKFTDLGYRIFSVSVSTASRAINSTSGFMPYLSGVFDQKGIADFSMIDKSIRDVVKICPNAYIFPRIYLCMPTWWCEENPDECIETPVDGMREALYSDKFKTDCGEMLKQIINHINSQDYADNILGYQLSGGNTQEWFHLDERQGSFGDVALPYFNRYLEENYPGIPKLTAMPESIFVDGNARDDYMLKYRDFANDSVADTVDYFCRIAKEETDFKQLVGAFYGYTFEVINPVEGTHALSKLLDSKYIDFFSSPNSYVSSRPLGIDWGDMMPVDSIKMHGKFCFLECDIRTHLSLSPGESREGSDPRHYYTSAVWRGPKTDKLSCMALRKCYARQFAHRHAFWWFDMFGHWYDTEGLLSEAERSLRLAENYRERTLDFDTEVAVFVDERAYKLMPRDSDFARSVVRIRTSLGGVGVNYHSYLIEDFDRLMTNGIKYKAIIFACVADSEKMTSAVNYCSENKIFFIKFNENKYSFTAPELRNLLKGAGVHTFIDEGEDVLYTGAGLLALHAHDAGKKTIKLPRAVKVTPLTDEGKAVLTDTLRFDMEEFETKIFVISE